MDDLSLLWTRGLLLLKPHIERADLLSCVQRTTLSLQHPRYDEAVHWRYGVGNTLELSFAPEILDWYDVEQDELMLFAALMTSLYFKTSADGYARNVWDRHSVSDERLGMCRLVGCSPSATDSPSERWRLMAAKGCAVSDLTLARFPTECRVCKRFINSDEPDKRAHALCRTYVRSVIIPQLQADKIAAAGAMDK